MLFWGTVSTFPGEHPVPSPDESPFVKPYSGVEYLRAVRVS